MIRFTMFTVAWVGLIAMPRPQPIGTVLTDSEIQYPHLMRRPVVAQGRQWVAVVAAENGSSLRPADVRWTASVEFGDSVFQLSVQPPAPLLLVADVPALTLGPVSTLTRFEQPLSAESPLAFEVDGSTYALALEGSAPGMCDATVTLTEGLLSQELYFPQEGVVSCDEPHFSVQWAGDLDRDGRLDLVATFSPKYSYYPRRLFLSSAAAPGALVGLVAAFDAAAA